jgi:excisionase family DNA binding protein
MVQGYYTLEEAAQILGMNTDKLSQMAQRREIRAFADRGTWRFRTQDVEELGRQMGIGSDPELQMGERSSKSSGKLPQVKAKKTTGAGGDADLFEFELSGSEELSIELDDPGAAGKKTALGGGTKAKKTNISDEDILVSPSVEDAPIGFLDESGRSSSKMGPASSRGKTGSGKVKTGTNDPDSGLRLVQMDDDGIPIPQDYAGGKVDSDVKLDPADMGDLPPTEEVRLDELDAQLDSSSTKKSSGKLGKASGSAGSPFELSEDDLELDLGESETKKMTKVGGGGSGRKMTQAAPPPSDDDDEVSLGDLTLGDGDFSGASGASGINLHLPADTGINLERAASTGGDDEVEFELSLDGDGDDLVTGPSTTKGLQAPKADDSSESEFELTLGEDGGLAPLDDGIGESSDSTEVAEEKDIFETDFEIPALDEESGSEVQAVEDSEGGDFESSDFEFDATASDEEMEDSGSQVMAIDDEEEEADDSKSQVVAIDDEEAAEEEDELADMTAGSDGEEEEEEEEEELVTTGAALPPAPWGALPTIFMLPCVVVMGLLGLLTFEMLHGMWGYRQPHKPATLLIKPVTELFGGELPKD